MEKTVLVPIAQGTEEIEAVVVIDLLRRAGINVKVAAESDIITCARGVKIIPDVLLENISDDDIFDAIILPGGSLGTDNFKKSELLEDIIIAHRLRNNVIAAICAAPTFLSEKNLIPKSSRITSHPSVRSQLEHFNYSEDNVVNDNGIITSRGAGTAFDFALEIIKVLVGEDTAKKVAEETVY